ncbi:MAG: hypothetical protein V1784_04220, partial [bacterium]
TRRSVLASPKRRKLIRWKPMFDSTGMRCESGEGDRGKGQILPLQESAVGLIYCSPLFNKELSLFSEKQVVEREKSQKNS